MNILKFGRGDFFGIIIPGAFLTLNIMFFVFGSELSSLTHFFDSKYQLNIIAFLLFFIVPSYMFGFVLRAISPAFVKNFFWIPIINQLKIAVFEKSPALRDEIIYDEGVVRFVSGIFIALLTLIIILSYNIT